MNILRLLFKIISGFAFAGFVFPLWLAHNTSFSATQQAIDVVVDDPTRAVNSMPYESFSKDLASIGYIWDGMQLDLAILVCYQQ